MSKESFDLITLETVGDSPWSLLILPAGQRVELDPPEVREVNRAIYGAFPTYVPDAWGGWQKGACLRELRAQECSCRGALDPASLRVESDDGRLLEYKKDFDGDFDWGSFGRLPEGSLREGETVLISYRYSPQRIDSVMRRRDGSFVVRKGEVDMATPLPPEPGDGEVCVGNVHFSGNPPRLTGDMLYPVLEQEYPESDLTGSAAALLPETLRKLRSGDLLRILAFGDSVTNGGFLTYDDQRWQSRFVAELKERFPQARIELLTVSWGGRNSESFLTAPAGSAFHYDEKVQGAKPDLVVMEFVNDAGLQPEQWEANYSRFLKDFQSIGAEWLILTPHYIRPDWMGLDGQREIDEDPRAYVKFLRRFTKENGVALADASLRYGRLWRQGIPYNTLMLNCINHPDHRGISIFVRSLMALFPER